MRQLQRDRLSNIAGWVIILRNRFIDKVLIGEKIAKGGDNSIWYPKTTGLSQALFHVLIRPDPYIDNGLLTVCSYKVGQVGAFSAFFSAGEGGGRVNRYLNLLKK